MPILNDVLTPSVPLSVVVVQNVALLMMKQNQDRYFVKLTPDIQGQVSMMAIVGAMCGQMIFGVVGDQVRLRKRAGGGGCRGGGGGGGGVAR